MTKKFIKEEVTSVPSCSGKEGMLREHIEQFADERGISHCRDAKGNLYLTKGASTGFYPCLANHMDTVQFWQGAFVDRHARLDIRERVRDGHTELYTAEGGIGADDVNVVGNPNVFKPSPYIEVDSFVWDGKTVIRVHVPVSGDVHSYRGDIYDRMGEVDVKIRATAQIADLYMRKKGIYTEREVFPSLKLEDFRVDLLPLVRREAQNHLTDGKRHPWMDMDDEALFRASGLIDEDKATKEVGFNLAAVLLLGKDETLMRICPQYETDALLRVENVDRYDDRRIVRTNLLESYDELLDFSRKHLPAPFFLEEDKRLNLREIIVREMVANLLIHREFTSLDKSEFVIERERMYTSNPCNPMQDGRITPENVRPRAKNPIIAGFFREIGRADRLGSGVRNLYKYCKDYGGADPVFTEGNCFVISVSLKKLDSIRFPFKKQPIGSGKQPIGPDKQPIGGEKPSIESGKPSIEPEKPSIGFGKPSIDDLASKYGLT